MPGREAEIEASSGGRVRGIATIAASTSASAPTTHSSHRMVLNDQTINNFGMILLSFRKYQRCIGAAPTGA